MAANCKNTSSLPVLCWQGNWTPDIDQKKAPTEAGALNPTGSRSALARVHMPDLWLLTLRLTLQLVRQGELRPL